MILELSGLSTYTGLSYIYGVPCLLEPDVKKIGLRNMSEQYY